MQALNTVTQWIREFGTYAAQATTRGGPLWGTTSDGWIEGTSSQPAPRAQARKAEPRACLQEMRKAMVACVDDCPAAERDRILFAVLRGTCGLDLFLLRVEIFQCVSRHYGQTTARERVNALLPLFKGYLPAAQLRLI